MQAHRLETLLAPRSIALVGASSRPNTPGHDMIRMLKRGGFTGDIHPINPQYKEIDGSPCIPHLIDLPKAPDLVVLSVRNDRLEDTLKEAISIGAKSAVIFASGLLPNDTFPVLTNRLTTLVNSAQMPVCGGNCMGFYNNLDRVWVCGFPNPREPHQGSIALISHSGSVFGALAHNDPRLRFALTISPGQELNTTVADYIDFALERPEVKVIGLFIETARDPSGFQAALAKAAKCGVPVVALKLGRTEAAAAAALTHTGALVGSDSAYQSIFDKYGVVRVETLDELASTLLLFSTGRSASQGSLVSIHDSGGECELFIDVADRVGVDFLKISDTTKDEISLLLDPGLEAKNPLDAWGTGLNFISTFEKSFYSLITDENAAIGAFVADIRDEYYVSDGFAAAAIAVANRSAKPVVFITNYTQLRHDKIALRLTEAGVPVLDGTQNGLIAIRGALAHRDFCKRLKDELPKFQADQAKIKGLLNTVQKSKGTLGENASLSILSQYGIPVVPYLNVQSEASAVEAALAIGYPIALKTAAEGVYHKTESKGVFLNINSEAELRSAWSDLNSRLGSSAIVAKMIPKGVEIALGMINDPQFGPLVSVSAGGVLVEILSDTQVALAPFGVSTALRLLNALSISPLLSGHRGEKAVDINSLAEIISKFSLLCIDLAEHVQEIDVNPLVCSDDIYAVDALFLIS